MSRKSLKYSALLFATLLATALTGCGTGNKEAGTVADVTRVEESKCRVCHASSIDPASGTSIIQDFVGAPASGTTAAILPSVHFQLPDGTPNADAGCQGCHGGGAQHNGVGPIPFPDPAAAGRCNVAECHNNKVPADVTVNNFSSRCGSCHGDRSVHNIQYKDPALYNDCIGCHAIVQTHPTNVVKDNNSGVRAVTAEFSKWSHHVTGVNLQNAHCAACHLEGKAEGGKIVVDRTYHMADNKTHLRHADTDADMQWDPAAPNHTTMDNFCMSCHDANGAISAQSAVIRTLMIPAAGKTASARNPFADTISNRYDKMLRPGVVDVDSQFNTTNNSHHGVKGPRYTGRTRDAGPRQIANPAAFAANSSAALWGKRSTIYDSVNAILGVKETANAAFNALYVPLENAGGEAFPRTGAQSLGDDSTLHCGDCHTVGQWKPGTAKSFEPTAPTTEVAGFVSPAIGAHGSNNEYMLRNSRGTDERHTQDAYVKELNGNITLQNRNAAFLVCFNCHSYSRYGSVYNATGTRGPHAGEYDVQGRCNGVGNTIPFNGYTTGTATDGTQFLSRFEGPRSLYGATPAFAPGFPLNEANRPATGEQDPDFGNIFGIQCSNCHNSGIGNAYGGIHGSPNNSPGTANTTLTVNPTVKGGAYVDGMGNTTKVQRFMPGLGNIMHVPGTLGGFTGGTTAGPITNSTFVYTFTTGGISNDTNWEQVAWTQTAGQPVTVVNRAGAGCYTLPGIGTDAQVQAGPAYGIQGPSVTGEGGPTVDAYKTWGGCDDHGAEAGRASATSQGGKGGGHYGFIKRITRPVTY